MAPTDFEHLKLVIEGRVAVLELDHGKANEMGTPQLAELERLAGGLEAPEGPVALITWSRRRTGRGTAIFVSGADVTERVGWGDDRVKAHVRWQREILGRLRRAPAFHVAVVDGLALGWGTEYLLACDWRIACDGAAFGLPETGLGILPGAGGTSELAAQIGVAHTLRLGMTGERIGPDEALRIGLVQERAADVEAGLARARALAALVERRSPTAVGAFKRGVLAALGRDEAARREIEASAYEHCVDTGEARVGREGFERIRAGEAVPWASRAPFPPPDPAR